MSPNAWPIISYVGLCWLFNNPAVLLLQYIFSAFGVQWLVQMWLYNSYCYIILMKSLNHKAYNNIIMLSMLLRHWSLELDSFYFFLLPMHGPTHAHAGSGKTTLLNAIAGYIPVSKGSVFVDGVDLSIDGTARKNMSYVMQSELFFEDLTLRETLVVGVEWHTRWSWSWYNLTHTHCEVITLAPQGTIDCQSPPGANRAITHNNI